MVVVWLVFFEEVFGCFVGVVGIVVCYFGVVDL